MNLHLKKNTPRGYPFFSFKKDILHAENISLEELAKTLGTPLYVYSLGAIRSAWSSYSDSMDKKRSDIICYGMKANSNLSILKEFSKLGSGFDIVSGGELLRAISINADPKKIVFSGVGKSTWEISLALETGIKSFNVESEEELHVISDIAKSMQKKACISLRVNPEVDANTHPYISTALKESKFGIPIDHAISIYKKAETLPNLSILGLDCHIGSQILSIEPYLDALEKLILLIKNLKKDNIHIKVLDLGGGLGISYHNEKPFPPKLLFKEVLQRLHINQLSNLQLILEPGRSLIGNAGVLLTTVQYIKPIEHGNLAIVDAGMNDLLRPALYQAYHRLQTVNQSGKELSEYSVVGPICESADWFAKKRMLPQLKRGDIIALESVGAYGMVMSSNYNSHLRAAEIIVDGNKYYIARHRETFNDLIKGEKIIDFNKVK